MVFDQEKSTTVTIKPNKYDFEIWKKKSREISNFIRLMLSFDNFFKRYER